MALALAAATAALVPTASPATAQDAGCTGGGTAVVNSPHDIASAPKDTGFGFSVVACAPSLFTAYGAGTLSGTCEATTGYGTVNGRSFTLTGSAYTFTLTGEVTGTLNFYGTSIPLPCRSISGTHGGFYAGGTIAFTG